MKGVLQKMIFGVHYRWWALSVVALANFMATTDNGLVGICLPVIINEFHADITLAGWVVLIYALVNSSLYLPFGRLADQLGQKKMFTAGFLIYAASSAVAGFAQNPLQLILFRALQAAGSALMSSLTFALVTTLFPFEERGRAMGISGGTFSAVGHILGPVLGGLIAYTWGWRFIFYVTSSLGIVGFLAAQFILREDKGSATNPGRKEPFDFMGIFLLTLGLVLLLLALTTGQKGIWRSWALQGEIFLALLALALFVGWESRTPYPLLDLKLFSIREFTAGNVARLVSFITLSMNNLIMPFFLQLGLGLDLLQSGLLMVFNVVGVAILSPLSGWFSERMGSRVIATAGLTIMALAFFFLGSLGPGSSTVRVVLGLVLVGTGLGLFQTPNNYSVMSSVPANRLGIASSFVATVRSIGSTLGAALAATIVNATLLARAGQTSLEVLQSSDPQVMNSALGWAFIEGYRYTQLCAGMLTLIGIFASAMKGPAKKK